MMENSGTVLFRTAV